MVLALLISNFLLIKFPREENRVGELHFHKKNLEEIQDQIAICAKTNIKRISNEYLTNIKQISNEYQTNFKRISNEFQTNIKRISNKEKGNKSPNRKGKVNGRIKNTFLRSRCKIAIKNHHKQLIHSV